MRMLQEIVTASRLRKFEQFNNLTIPALIDTDCSVCRFLEDLYPQTAGLPKLSNNTLVLSGKDRPKFVQRDRWSNK